MAGFRTVVINKRCKLESMLGFLVIKSTKEERVYIKEIETLVIESTAVALTTSLVVDLVENGVNVIFCDRRHFPCSNLVPTNAHFRCARNIYNQMNWSKERKAQCWKLIIQEKIRQQMLLLRELNYIEVSERLGLFRDTVNDGDTGNCEGLSSKMYFSELFGNKFLRRKESIINTLLNYGYTLLLSSFAREISTAGYLNEIGIWHHGGENAYNLACDLMEPYRIVVDKLVDVIIHSSHLIGENEAKRRLLFLFESVIEICGDKQSLIPSIRIYLHRIFRFLQNEVDDIYTIKIISDYNELSIHENDIVL